MRKTNIVGFCLLSTLIISVFVCGGCDDEFRKTIVPYLYEGGNQAFDALLEESCDAVNSVADGLVAGLANLLYPEGGFASNTSS